MMTGFNNIFKLRPGKLDRKQLRNKQQELNTAHLDSNNGFYQPDYYKGMQFKSQQHNELNSNSLALSNGSHCPPEQSRENGNFTCLPMSASPDMSAPKDFGDPEVLLPDYIPQLPKDISSPHQTYNHDSRNEGSQHNEQWLKSSPRGRNDGREPYAMKQDEHDKKERDHLGRETRHTVIPYNREHQITRLPVSQGPTDRHNTNERKPRDWRAESQSRNANVPATDGGRIVRRPSQSRRPSDTPHRVGHGGYNDESRGRSTQSRPYEVRPSRGTLAESAAQRPKGRHIPLISPLYHQFLRGRPGQDLNSPPVPPREFEVRTDSHQPDRDSKGLNVDLGLPLHHPDVAPQHSLKQDDNYQSSWYPNDETTYRNGVVHANTISLPPEEPEELENYSYQEIADHPKTDRKHLKSLIRVTSVLSAHHPTTRQPNIRGMLADGDTLIVKMRAKCEELEQQNRVLESRVGYLEHDLMKEKETHEKALKANTAELRDADKRIGSHEQTIAHLQDSLSEAVKARAELEERLRNANSFREDLENKVKKFEWAKLEMEEHHEQVLTALEQKHEDDFGSYKERKEQDFLTYQNDIRYAEDSLAVANQNHAILLQQAENDYNSKSEAIAQNHKIELDRTIETCDSKLRNMKAAIDSMQATFQAELKKKLEKHRLEKEHLKTALVHREHIIKGMEDSQLSDDFKDLAAQVQLQAMQVEWDRNMASTWPISQADLIGSKNEIIVLKRNAIQSMLWTVLHDGIFCTPFRIFGEEGKLLETQWGSSFPQDRRSVEFAWPKASLESEKWRYEKVKQCFEAKERGYARMANSYEQSLGAVSNDLKDVLNTVCTVDDRAYAKLSVLAETAAGMWLNMEMQRFRVFVVMADANTASMQSGADGAGHRTVHGLVCLPGLRRIGNARGEELDREWKDICKGNFT